MEHGYPFYALTSSPAEEIEAWRENTGAEYEFFLADDIVLKTIIRKGYPQLEADVLLYFEK